MLFAQVAFLSSTQPIAISPGLRWYGGLHRFVYDLQGGIDTEWITALQVPDSQLRALENLDVLLELRVGLRLLLSSDLIREALPRLSD